MIEFLPDYEEDQDLLETEPGISSFSGGTDGLDTYMGSLLAQAARWVPASEQPNTQVRALATAGMRMLSEQEQTPIWDAIAAAVRASPFALGATQTIAGEYEGIFNWMSVKYILDAPSNTRPTWARSIWVGHLRRSPSCPRAE